jgi:perosamine synthetase
MMTKIPQTMPFVGRSEMKNIRDVVKSKWFTEGKYAKEFVELIQKKTSAEYVFLAPNGTLAIYVALLASGIKRNDWVIVPDFTFNATASPLHFIGAKPQFVDVDAKTLCIDPNLIEENIDKRTKAIMPVHLFGQSANMQKIMKIAWENDLLVIEDAAQAYGAYHYTDGFVEHVGTIGDTGIISFFSDKSVTSGGEGAAILTDDKDIAHRIQVIRNQGRQSSGTFTHDELGMNFRMTDLQCAIGVAQLNKFDDIENRKKRLWNEYDKYLGGTCLTLLQKGVEAMNIVPFRYFIRAPSEEVKLRIMKRLESINVQTRGAFMPLHMQPCWKHLKYNNDGFDTSIDAYQTGICLPIYPTLKKRQVEYICLNIIEAINEKKLIESRECDPRGNTC